MIKALLIAEKPSLAQAIKEGYASYPNKKYDITYLACAGHLMETLKPDEYCAEWKKWELDVLPMIPKRFQSKVSKNGFTRYKAIKDALKTNSYDLVINAGDPAREGELIVDEILKSLNCKLPELRLWTEDLTVDGICHAFDTLLQPQNNLKKAAYLRQWNDWLVGMNCSRAASLSTGCSISIGRVMSVITAMIVNRDKQRQLFKPEEYYKCAITIDRKGDTFEGMLLKNHKDTKFYSQDEVQYLMNKAEVTGEVISVTKYTKTTAAPLLLNLTELQKEAFSKYGYAPDITLKLAQNLYEKKLISYPRTDCRYLSKNVASGLYNNLKALAQIPEYSHYVSKILSNQDSINKICNHGNQYVDNSKLTDHHALITTTVPARLYDLTEREQNIYRLIAQRVVAIFLPPKVTSKSEVICQFGEISTISKSQGVVREGYSELISSKSTKKELPELSEGDKVSILNVEGQILETQPPAYYNYKTLLEDMENCAVYATEKEADILASVSGIGQPSTRDSIIKNVISLNYIKEAGTGTKRHLESTPEGRYIVDLLKDTELISVSATAKMESRLAAVERGEYDANTYYLEMIADIKRLTEQLKGLPKASDDNPLKKSNKYAKKSQSVNTDLLCPICGKQIMESDKGFYCSGWKEKSCKYYLGKEVFGVKLSLQDFKTLLAGGQINRRFTWRSGKKSNALLSIKDNKYKFDFI